MDLSALSWGGGAPGGTEAASRGNISHQETQRSSEGLKPPPRGIKVVFLLTVLSTPETSSAVPGPMA